MSYLAIFLTSFGILVNEIMLSAIFHVLLGSGNTVSAIAFALVGSSAGGIFAYSIPTLNDPERADQLYPKLLLAFGVALVVSGFLIIRIPISHGDLAFAGSSPVVQMWRLVVYHLAVLPFFLGGLTIAVLLRRKASVIGPLYFCDLAGAATGCVASPWLLSAIGAPAAIAFGATPAILTALWLLLRKQSLPKVLAVALLGILAVGVLRPSFGTFATLNTMGEVENPAYRSFRIGPGDLDYEEWALDAWTVIRNERIPQQWERFRGWGLSPVYDGPIPRTKFVNFNARFSTYITEFDGSFDRLGAWLDADLSSLHLRLGRTFEQVLNIGAGGGREVLAALHHDAERVVAVDISDAVINDIMKGYLRDFSGDLYFDPRVTAVADEGRTYAERTEDRFDLVEFSLVGGANLEKMDLVRVDDLFTIEALRTYFERLSDDGVFSYVMYSTRSDLMDEIVHGKGTTQPFMPAPRTLTGLRIALMEQAPNAVFADHVLIAALPGLVSPTYDLVHIVVGKEPFTAEQRQKFGELCDALQFTRLYPPTSATAGGLYEEIVEAPDLKALADSLPVSIWPTSDDRPFQYTLDWPRLVAAFDRGRLLQLLSENPFFSLGTAIGSLAVAITLIPLAVIRIRTGRGPVKLRANWPVMLYFACIGYAYMAVEIPALLRLQSYLGKPVYGLSVALFSFLLFSGLGSYLTNRLAASQLHRALYAIVPVILGSGIGFLLFSEPLFSGTIGQPLWQRVLIATASIFPLAFPMGMMFPIGIRLLARDAAELIPWAWAINGCVSVVAIFGSRIAAVVFGYGSALVLGLVAYSFVVVCVLADTRRGGRRFDSAETT